MPAAPPINRYNPSFLRYPIQNNRTGFQPVYLPLILIVPGRRNAAGQGISNSDVSNVKFYIAEAPDPAIVVGHQYITGVSETEIQHLTVPDLKELFTLNISRLQLTDVQITLQGLTFTNANGDIVPFDEAVEGDVFTYTTINGHIKSTIPFYPDADYYDVSKFILGVDDLPMPFTYLFVWQCSYFRRTVLPDNTAISEGPFCITDKNAISRFNILIQHPGDVHHEMFRKTPPFYFESEGASLASQIAQSNILKFYRPFADILQDITDEQSFINGINHINRIPAQLIPYLAYIIGWDLPNFPKVTDTLRRSILRQAVELQKLKGTRLAITELFETFGFTIDLINLWYSSNGKRLIAPGETLSAQYKDEEITVQTVCQIDLLLNRYNTSGFGQFNIPLLYKSTGNITLNAWLVRPGPTDTVLTNITDQLITNPDDLVGQCETSIEGFLIPRGIIDALPSSDSTVLGTAEVLINFENGIGELVMNSSNPILNKTNIKYNKVTNILTLNFDHYLDFSDGSYIYVFATYPRTQLGIPSVLSNTRSNRFDIEIFSKSDEETVDTDIIEYLLNFLFNLKAFHSLLRRIVFRVRLVDVYNVTDYCSPFNTLELPPPIIRPDLSGCPQVLPNDESTKFRNDLYDALVGEHEAWKLLDNTHQTTQEERDKSLLPVNAPVGEECQFNPYGQDRVYQDDSLNPDIDPDTREKACVITQPSVPFCFKGRVKDELIIKPTMILQEIVRCFPCALSVGSGVYYLLPTNAKILMENGFGKFDGQNNIRSFLGKKITQYGKPTPVALHYTNRPYLSSFEFENNQLLGYQRPSLEIDKDNYGMPAHRFITLNKLESDYTSSWRAKPWDFDTNVLNAHLTDGTDGNQYIVYDDIPNTYIGNGLVPDISSYGEHASRSFISTHKIFMKTAPSHPAITLDGVVETEIEDIEIGTTGPIFRSYNQSCNKDYRSGYPAEFGRFDVNMSEHDFNRGDGTDLIGELLGIPTERTDVTGLSALFTYGSQILLSEDDFEYNYYRPYRYDCECARFGCSGTGSFGTVGTDPTFRTNIDTCLLNKYLLSDGSHDFNCDQLTLETRMLFNEYIGMCSFKYDKEITNSICILISPDGTLPLDEAIPPVGLVHYMDGYGVIYETTWTYINRILDIKTTIKSPHVWGQPDEGYVEGLKVFRRGIVTVTGKKIRVNEDGSYEVLVIYEEEQFIAFFQSNVTCFDMPFVDNFCFHFNCSVDDQLDVLVTCGSRWVDPSDTQVEWPDLIVNSAGVVTGYTVSSGIQPFLWVNVFGNDDALVHICEGATTGAS